MEKTKRTYQIDEDVVDALEEWGRRTRVGPSDAAQLGLFIIMSLTPEQREQLIGHMDARDDIQVLGLAVKEEPGAAGRPEPGEKPGSAKRRDAG